MKLTPRWSYEVDDDVAGGPAHGAGLARGDGVEPFHRLHVLDRRARLGGLLHVVDGLGSSPSSSPTSSPSSSSVSPWRGGRILRAVKALVVYRTTGPTDCRPGTVGGIMVGGKVARRAVAVSLDPINLWGGLWRAVRISTAARFLPRVGFLVAVGGHCQAGGGGGDGG